MDINTLSTVSEDDGTLVHLKDAGGQPLYDGEGESATPVTALVAGTYSKRYRSALKKVVAKNTKASRRGDTPSDEEAFVRGEDNAYFVEAACILTWSFTAGDSPFPITAENWKSLVAKQPQWQEQVKAAMGDHERFFAPR